MSVIVNKIFDGCTVSVDKDGKYKSAEVKYLAVGTSSTEEAISAVLSAAPSTLYDTLALDTVGIEERLDAGFKLSASYEYSDDAQADESEQEPAFSFDTSGGTQHITQSLATKWKYPDDAPDYKGAIGWNGSDLEGVDIAYPVSNFTETYYMLPAKIDNQYKKKITSTTGTINNKSFRGYSAGEVLFLGATGSRRGKTSTSLWEITFKFAVAPARKVVISNTTVSKMKRGWDYMWIRYKDETDTAKKTVKRIAEAAYIEQVYHESDFGNLGIGN